jgi:hypothetical protein
MSGLLYRSKFDESFETSTRKEKPVIRLITHENIFDLSGMKRIVKASDNDRKIIINYYNAEPSSLFFDNKNIRDRVFDNIADEMNTTKSSFTIDVREIIEEGTVDNDHWNIPSTLDNSVIFKTGDTRKKRII